MTHTHIVENTPMTIQLQGLKMNEYLNRQLLGIVPTLKELTDEIGSIDAVLAESVHESISPRTLTVTVTHAGLQLTAKDSGKQWKFLIKHVQERLKRHIEQRKELLKRQSILRATAADRVQTPQT